MRETLSFYETITFNGHPGEPRKIDVKPGTLIYGARDFYYDMDGVIIDYKRINSTGDLNIDWLIFVGFQSYDGGLIEVPCYLENINFATYASEIIVPELFIPSQNLFEKTVPMLLTVDEELADWVLKNPGRINDLHPAAFENLIKQIYKNQGFDIEEMGRWNQADGGVDLFAIQKSVDSIDLKLAIQCKRTKNNVQPKVIRELNGVLDKNQAHIGIVATSSYFTEATKEEAKNYLWRIQLQDRDSILDKMYSIFR